MSATRMSDDDSMLAAEFALGILEGTDHSSADRRYADEAAFAAEVDLWRRILAPLAAETLSVEPPSRLWNAIAERTRRGIPVALSAPRLVSAAWRWLALSGMAAAAASIAALLVVVQPAERLTGPGFGSVIAAQSGEALAVVTLTADRRMATITPLAMTRQADRSVELWFIAPGETPRSMGVVNVAGTHNVAMDVALPAGTPGDALALSLEPQGGSPTGLPTGPVIGQGTLGAI